MPRPRKPASPFRYFNISPELIRLVVVMPPLAASDAKILLNTPNRLQRMKRF